MVNGCQHIVGGRIDVIFRQETGQPRPHSLSRTKPGD
jgi:hypothetical protein